MDGGVETQFRSGVDVQLDTGGNEIHLPLTPTHKAPGVLAGRKQYSQAFVDGILKRNNVHANFATALRRATENNPETA